MRLKYILQLGLTMFVTAIILSYFVYMAPKFLVAIYSTAQNLIKYQPAVKIIQNTIRPYLPITTSEELFLKINQYRSSFKLPPYSQESAVCNPINEYRPETENIFAACPTCTHATLLSISQYSDSNTLMEQLLADASAKEAISSTTLTHLCVREAREMLSLFFAQKTAAKPKPQGSVPLKPIDVQATHFSEDDLWNALSQYRKAQGRNDLVRDENLCVYARKRIQDHLNLMKDKQPETYPMPDKYPLDAHSGFSADAASGYAFEVTHKNQLAENLAYWPGAKSPVHIIEWGWDSSTEGHRQAQLSNDWNSACITGNEGFYVAIFGK